MTIVTKDSLDLIAGRYASILFRVTTAKQSAIPPQYTFRETGSVPEGMIFESYPCNKPGETNCVMLASSDGIFLDGVPRQAGRYTITIHAAEAGGKELSRSFTVVVNGR